eukprot:scaffold1564_cov174-Amphora_coffeaeformis.AAC.26
MDYQGSDDVVEVLYLHGFGCTVPANSRVAKYLQKKVVEKDNRLRLQTPCYHPSGESAQTDYLATMRELSNSFKGENALLDVGYSAGGYLAALWASQKPELVRGLILLAPAIDNYERNFRNVPECKYGICQQATLNSAGSSTGTVSSSPNHSANNSLDKVQVPIQLLRRHDNDRERKQGLSPSHKNPFIGRSWRGQECFVCLAVLYLFLHSTGLSIHILCNPTDD